MGCDIHVVVQVRGESGWVSTPDLGPRLDGDYDWPILTHRNYALFSVLGDVRNGSGFAGHYTYEPVRPIGRCRGIPQGFDIGGSYGETHAFPDPSIAPRWMGDHSHSYVTLAELLAYDWNHPMLQGGYLTQEEYEKWDKHSMPDGWCGAAFGPSTVCLSEEEYVKAPRLDPANTYYIGCRWQTPLRDRMGEFVDRVIPWLQSLGSPENVRLVFGFDS